MIVVGMQWGMLALVVLVCGMGLEGILATVGGYPGGWAMVKVWKLGVVTTCFSIEPWSLIHKIVVIHVEPIMPVIIVVEP